MENIVLHLKLIRRVRGAPFANMVFCHIKMEHTSLGYDAYLNLGGEMIAKAPIGDAKLNLTLTQKCLDGVYLSDYCDTFKVGNAWVHQFSQRYVYMKWSDDLPGIEFHVQGTQLTPGVIKRERRVVLMMLLQSAPVCKQFIYVLRIDSK